MFLESDNDEYRNRFAAGQMPPTVMKTVHSKKKSGPPTSSPLSGIRTVPASSTASRAVLFSETPATFLRLSFQKNTWYFRLNCQYFRKNCQYFCFHRSTECFSTPFSSCKSVCSPLFMLLSDHQIRLPPGTVLTLSPPFPFPQKQMRRASTAFRCHCSPHIRI